MASIYFTAFANDEFLDYPLMNASEDIKVQWATEVKKRLERNGIPKLTICLETKIILYLSMFSLYSKNMEAICKSLIWGIFSSLLLLAQRSDDFELHSPTRETSVVLANNRWSNSWADSTKHLPLNDYISTPEFLLHQSAKDPQGFVSSFSIWKDMRIWPDTFLGRLGKKCHGLP